jgi:hypothetical protein
MAQAPAAELHSSPFRDSPKKLWPPLITYHLVGRIQRTEGQREMTDNEASYDPLPAFLNAADSFPIEIEP